MRFHPPLFLSTLGNDIIQTGLIFDFRAKDYTSGSLTWNAYVGDYTASITGATPLPLIYTTSSIGFDGNNWLQFDNAMSASISSSNWEIYAFVNLATTSSNAYKPTFFAKGSTKPGWYYSYTGGTFALPSPIGNSNGTSFFNYNGGNGSAQSNQNTALGFGVSLRNVWPNTSQLFALSYPSSSAVLAANKVTLNWSNQGVGSTIIGDAASIGGINFSGSLTDPLTFGKGVDGQTNFSGSVVRLFGYNRLLSEQERKNNWFALTGQYKP